MCVSMWISMDIESLENVLPSYQARQHLSRDARESVVTIEGLIAEKKADQAAMSRQVQEQREAMARNRKQFDARDYVFVDRLPERELIPA